MTHALGEAGEGFLVHRAHQTLFVRNVSVSEVIGQGAVHRLHANHRVRFNDRIHLVGLALADEIFDGRDSHHDFDRRAASTAELW